MATTTNAKIVLTAEDRASRVIGQVKRQMTEAGTTAQSFASAVGLLNPAFAGLAGAAGLVAFVKHIIDARDALNDVADATGASIEGLSSLERVARLNGGTLDNVAGILLKFNQALSAADDPNSDAARTFAALGLSVKDLKEQDPSTALQKTAIALTGFADSGDKARGMLFLLGKQTKEGAAYLKDLAEAGEINASVTDDQAAAADRYNKQLFAMKVAAEDAGRALTKEIGGVLGDLVLRYQTASKVFGGFGGALSAGITQKLNFDDPVKGLTEYNRQLAELDSRVAKIDAGDRLGGGRDQFADLRIAKLKDERKELAQVAAYYRTLAGLDTTPGAPVDGVPKPRLKIPDKPRDKPKTDKRPAAYSYAEEVSQAVGRAIGDADVLKARQMADEVELLDKLFFDLGLSADLYESAMRKVTGITKDASGSTSIFREEQKRLADLLGDTASAKLERQREDMALLVKYMNAGAISAQQFGEAATAALHLVDDESKKTKDSMEKMLDQFARNAQDALGDTLEATLRGNFDSIGQLWGNLIIKMIAQASAAQLGQTLMGDFAKSGSLGGVFGDVLGAIGIGAPKANGGSVGALSLQRVNERGFEVFTTGGQDWLMTGGRGGVVTPNSQVAVAAPAQAGPAVVNHISVTAGVTRAEVTAAIQFAMKKTEASILASLRSQRVMS